MIAANVKAQRALDRRQPLLIEADAMQLYRSAFNLFVAVFGLWMVASGPYSLPGLFAEGSWLILLVGIASSIGVVVLCHELGIVGPENVPLHWTPRTLVYVAWLGWRVVVSSVDVVKRIWFGGPWVAPYVLEVEASQETDVGRATYANSITLTPGTVTIDIEGPRLTVHTIAKEVGEVLYQGKTNGWVYWVEQGSRFPRDNDEATNAESEDDEEADEA